MTLAFPNSSRSYDDAREVVRFMGYDGMTEVTFLVEARVLAAPGRISISEVESLKAFDAARGVIQDVAREAYSNSRKTSYTLTAQDFR